MAEARCAVANIASPLAVWNIVPGGVHAELEGPGNREVAWVGDIADTHISVLDDESVQANNKGSVDIVGLLARVPGVRRVLLKGRVGSESICLSIGRAT